MWYATIIGIRDPNEYGQSTPLNFFFRKIEKQLPLRVNIFYSYGSASVDVLDTYVLAKRFIFEKKQTFEPAY